MNLYNKYRNKDTKEIMKDIRSGDYGIKYKPLQKALSNVFDMDDLIESVIDEYSFELWYYDTKDFLDYLMHSIGYPLQFDSTLIELLILQFIVSKRQWSDDRKIEWDETYKETHQWIYDDIENEIILLSEEEKNKYFEYLKKENLYEDAKIHDLACNENNHIGFYRNYFEEYSGLPIDKLRTVNPIKNFYYIGGGVYDGE
jgi:hypothetical protein